jgi:hypothetical protein
MNSPVIRTKLPNSLPVILAAYPLAWLALLYAFVVRARLHLGHWPTPYQPDPKDLGLQPRRDGRVRCSAWLGGVVIWQNSRDATMSVVNLPHE